ncbi:uroporphyrinogen decarboxylase family protein [Planctomycetota bacterium]
MNDARHTQGADGALYSDMIDAHPRARQACDRVSAVINGRTPDRIPFSDSYWAGFTENYRRERDLPADTSMREHFDHDLVILAPTMGPWPSEAGEIEHDADGYTYMRDEYGLVMRSIPDKQTMPQHVDFKIKEARDLDRFPFEDPADPRRSHKLEVELAEVSTRFCPVLKLGGPFSRSWRLRGLERFLEDIAGDGPFVEAMVDRVTDHLIAVGTSAAARLAWPRIQLHIADDFAARNGPLFSPAVYERVFLPNLKKMVDAFHAMGFKISYESEGNVGPMLDCLDASGIDGLAHMEPRAGMCIEKIRRDYGTRFFLLGNICNTMVLPSGDRKAIASEVYRVLAAAEDGRYMGLSAHSIGTDVSSDAYDYFVALMKQYGTYPLDLNNLRQELR